MVEIKNEIPPDPYLENVTWNYHEEEGVILDYYLSPEDFEILQKNVSEMFGYISRLKKRIDPDYDKQE